jgi:hypothetical protein
LLTSDVDRAESRRRRVDSAWIVGLARHVAEATGGRASSVELLGASPRRRSWMSLIITAAPSSTQRLAVAKPMPVPAAR